jgi:tRNA A37 threonylcarbamoyltransferase TsaD
VSKLSVACKQPFIIGALSVLSNFAVELSVALLPFLIEVKHFLM